MDDFARKSAEDRRAYIEEAASRRDLTALIIEKDFWVCWTLKRLMSSELLRGSLTFKGGTSLSKAYGLIQRFSEDIDLTISRDATFLCDVPAPMEEGISGKQRKKRGRELKEAAQQYVQEIILPELSKAIEGALGTLEGWNVELDPDDPDAQTILFNYPQADGESDGGASLGAGYIKPRIKLEFGARGDTEPSGLQSIRPYLAEEFPEELPDALCTVPTLAAERTFWEKVTILHALYHNGKLRDGMSRHYYDTLMLVNGGIADQFDVELLAQVVRNKSIMFPDPKASYETAVLGSLKLIPSDDIVVKLQSDYAAMAEMFMETPPSFAELISGLEALESHLNNGS